ALTCSSTEGTTWFRKQANLLRSISRPEHECVEPEVSCPLRQCLAPGLGRTIQPLLLSPSANRTNHVVESPNLRRVGPSSGGGCVNDGVGLHHPFPWCVNTE